MTTEEANKKAKEFADSVTSKPTFIAVAALLLPSNQQVFKDSIADLLQAAYLQGRIDEFISTLDKAIPNFVTEKKSLIEKALQC